MVKEVKSPTWWRDLIENEAKAAALAYYEAKTDAIHTISEKIERPLPKLSHDFAVKMAEQLEEQLGNSSGWLKETRLC